MWVLGRCTQIPGWLKPSRRSADEWMPLRVAVAARRRSLQRARGDPSDEHRSFTGIERERDAEPVMVARGFPHRE